MEILKRILFRSTDKTSVIVKKSVGVRVPPSRKWDREIAKIIVGRDSNKESHYGF